MGCQGSNLSWSCARRAPAPSLGIWIATPPSLVSELSLAVLRAPTSFCAQGPYWGRWGWEWSPGQHPPCCPWRPVSRCFPVMERQICKEHRGLESGHGGLQWTPMCESSDPVCLFPQSTGTAPGPARLPARTVARTPQARPALSHGRFLPFSAALGGPAKASCFPPHLQPLPQAHSRG